jgi:hypothetical protein
LRPSNNVWGYINIDYNDAKREDLSYLQGNMGVVPADNQTVFYGHEEERLERGKRVPAMGAEFNSKSTLLAA